MTDPATPPSVPAYNVSPADQPPTAAYPPAQPQAAYAPPPSVNVELEVMLKRAFQMARLDLDRVNAIKAVMTNDLQAAIWFLNQAINTGAGGRN